MKFGLGVVIGKFLPPHRGHHLLIATAAEQAREVVVFVCAKPSDLVPGEVRGQWLREFHPTVTVRVIDDRYDENDTRVWAENTLRWLGRAPDVVFTSENYGEPYAALMGAQHVAVDPARRQRPVSGTAVRRDPYACWEMIEPPVRGWFARRVVVVGAESTGKTTLAAALAAEFATVWVEEYGREYSERKQRANDATWTTDEFVHIATEQNAREDAAARRANRVLIADTNAFATTLWHRRYLGHASGAVEAVARAGRCDLYLLAGDEIPFVQDGLRDGEHIRSEMQCWFETALAAQSVPWVRVRGSLEDRVRAASALIRPLLSPGPGGWSQGGRDAPRAGFLPSG